MKNALLLASAVLFPAVFADQIDDVQAGTGINFDLRGMTYTYTGAASGNGVVMDEDAPPACAPKDSGSLSFVLNTGNLGLPFNVDIPMTGTELSPTLVRWTTDTLINQCVTVVLNGTPTQVLIKRVSGRMTATSSAITPFFDLVCNRSYNTRLDDSGGNPENLLNAEAYLLCIQSTFTRIDFRGQDIDFVGYGGVGRLAPVSYSLSRGIALSGDISSIAASDDNYLVLRPGIVLSSQESPIQLVLNGTATTASPAELRFKVESRSNQPNITQKVELFNFATQVYDTYDVRQVPLSDGMLEVVVTSNVPNYVDPSTSALRAKLSYKSTGPVLAYPWLINIDQTVWTISP